MKNKLLKVILAKFLTKKGNKHLGEKILKNTIKKTQRTSKKSFSSFLKFGLVNITSTFIIRSQITKRGKKKLQKKTYVFLKSKKTRIKNSIKDLILLSKGREFNTFSDSLFKTLENSTKKTKNSTKKNLNVMLEISSQKKYISKFKW